MADQSTSETTQTQTPNPAAEAAPQETTSSSSTTTEGEAPVEEAPAGTTLLTGDGDADPAETAEGDGSGTDGDEDADAARAALFGAPEGDAAYQLEGLPEGTSVDEEALAAIAPVARELNLSNQGLSKIAGVYAEKVLPGVTQKVVSQIESDQAALTADWANQAQVAVKEDPVYAGQAMPVVRATAAKALDRFGGSEFREFLEVTGLGNHPAMLKFAYQAGAAIAEDTTFEAGGAKPPAATSRADKYYGAKS